jgi:hypothetical protein
MAMSVEAERVEPRDGMPQATSRELQRSKPGAEVHLQWFKAADGDWPAFDELDAQQLDDYGVFVVWRNGRTASVSAVLYVGRGALKQELAKCQRDAIFRDARNLYVTWARVEDLDIIDAVAAYLYQKLRPLWGEIVLVPPHAVNAPWAA